jgi:hypothetical protein
MGLCRRGIDRTRRLDAFRIVEELED